MTRFIREALRWKFVFYVLLLPALRRLGPAGYDASLCAGPGLGHDLAGKKSQAGARLRHAQEVLDLDGPIEAQWPALAANSARFLARDYGLDVASDEAVFGRFRVHGEEHLRSALSLGRGAILVGSHMGAHIAGLHWLFRSDLPVRALIQRPRHVSRELARRFDAARGPHSQADVFLRRDLPASARVERLIRARAALRDGLAIYLSGDIPWRGPNTQTRVFARPAAAVPFHLDRAGCPDPSPGLSCLLHPSARRQVRARVRGCRAGSAR